MISFLFFAIKATILNLLIKQTIFQQVKISNIFNLFANFFISQIQLFQMIFAIQATFLEVLSINLIFIVLFEN